MAPHYLLILLLVFWRKECGSREIDIYAGKYIFVVLKRKAGNVMQPKISLVTIWTDEIERMKEFYNEVLGFKIKNDLGNYVEFENDGVRFAICMREVMYEYSEEFRKQAIGQAFELAFPCESPGDVDESYLQLIARGAAPIQAPKDMPWNQRTAFFADPDGNIHEIFANL